MRMHFNPSRISPLMNLTIGRLISLALIASMALLPTGYSASADYECTRSNGELLSFACGERFNAKFDGKINVIAAGAKGAGSATPRTTNSSTGEYETIFEPELKMEYMVNSNWTIYSDISYFVTLPKALSGGSPFNYISTSTKVHASNEQFKFGLRFNEWFDLSYGPQKFVVGSGMLVGDGVLDCGGVGDEITGSCGGDYGEFLAGAFEAFRPDSFIAKFGLSKEDMSQMEEGKMPNNWLTNILGNNRRIDIFRIKGAKGESKGQLSTLYGLNFEWQWPDGTLGLPNGTLGLMYAVAPTARDQSITVPRAGRRYYNVRFNDVAISKNMTFNAEYVLEGGGGFVRGEGDSDLDRGRYISFSGANAYYLELEYRFDDNMLSPIIGNPVLGYRYYVGSGDKPDTEGKNESHDSLFYRSKVVKEKPKETTVCEKVQTLEKTEMCQNGAGTGLCSKCEKGETCKRIIIIKKTEKCDKMDEDILVEKMNGEKGTQEMKKYTGSDWGTWDQGEFAGKWRRLNNEDQRTHFLKLILLPPTDLISSIQLLAFFHQVDEGAKNGAYQAGDTFANEINVILEFNNVPLMENSMLQHFDITAVYAHASVGNAGRIKMLSGKDKEFNNNFNGFFLTFSKQF